MYFKLTILRTRFTRLIIQSSLQKYLRKRSPKFSGQVQMVLNCCIVRAYKISCDFSQYKYYFDICERDRRKIDTFG